MRANIMPELTWRWIKANDTLIELPSLEKKDFSLYEDSLIDDRFLDIFPRENYGISNDLIDLNREYRNWTNLIDVNSKEYFDINLDGNENILNDFHFIHLKDGEDKKLILDYYQDDGDVEGFRNSIFQVYLEGNSHLTLVLSQRLNEKSLSFLSLITNISKNAKFDLVHVDLGGKESYINFLGNVKEKDANFNIYSAYFAINDKKLDMVYVMKHLNEYTNSLMKVYGVLKDRSSKRFSGTLDFKKGSKHSIGEEEEVVTLLDKTAKSVTVPLLLSHESDIVGKHARSAGRVNEAMLYYIMSRGFSEDEAKLLIIESQMNPVIDMIDDDNLKNNIKEFIRRGIESA